MLLFRRDAAKVRGRAAVMLMAAALFGLPVVIAQQSLDVDSSQNPYSGSSVTAEPVAGTLNLTLQEAIARGLHTNLGLLLSGEDRRAANGDRRQALSRLLPQVNGGISGLEQELDLQAMVGPKTLPPSIPAIPSPFHVFDAQLAVSAPLLNLSNLEASRAASQELSAARFTYQQARDTVVLAVGNAYLMAIAGEAQVQSATSERDTAQALYQLAKDRETAGLSPQIDTLRALVELKQQQENLLAAQNAYATEKLNLARAIGLADGQAFELATHVPYKPISAPAIEDAVAQAYQHRGDYQAAMAEVAAAEAQVRAARAQRYPSAGVNASWGDIGAGGLTDGHQTYLVAGSVNVPLFQGGRVRGEIQTAQARLNQVQSKLSNLREQIDYDVRTALLNLNTNADQVGVAQTNTTLAAQTLDQSRDRFSSGVTNNVEVVQAQQAVAQADEVYVASLYRYSISKLNLARAMGVAEHEGLSYLGEK
ncbi:MAG: TolC family protein [Acidobacteriota bacterium]